MQQLANSRANTLVAIQEQDRSARKAVSCTLETTTRRLQKTKDDLYDLKQS